MKKKFLLYAITLSIPFFLSLLFFICYLRYSYILVPFKAVADYELKLKIAEKDGYYKFEPGIYENTQMGSVFSINVDGFRGPIKKSDLKDKYSVVALGESSTMGIEVNDPHTWPELLGGMLQTKGLDAVVFNAGVGGINSSQMLNMYKYEVKDLNPKVIIYYAGRNDHGLGGGLTRYPGQEKWPGGFLNWFKQYLIFKKMEIRFFQYRILGKQYFDIFPWVNRWIPLYEDNLTQIIKLAKSSGTCFIIAQQIMPYDEILSGYLQKHDFEGARRVFSSDRANWPELFRQIDLYEAQVRVARDNQVPFVSLLGESGFYDHGLFFQNDTVHLSAKGNQFIASQLVGKIDRLCSDR